MRINYLKLRNFGNVYSAFNKSEVEVTFPDNGNVINLYIGENGSGKTTIMSQLHPFADGGTGEVRTVRELLIPIDDDGNYKEAYKELHIEDAHNKYIIKHFFSRRGSVKSYITKNGVELNENGNVTSFKEYVEDELTINQDFLKLMRLGSNSRTFLKMSPSERKNFAVELMSDVEIYGKMFKKVSEDVRVLRRILQNVANNLQKINISDSETLKGKIRESENVLSKEEEIRESLLSETTKFRTLFQQVAPQGIQTLKDKLSRMVTRIRDLKKEIGKSTMTVSEAEKKDMEIRSKVQRVADEVLRVSKEHDRLLTQASEEYQELSRLETEMSRLSSTNEVSTISKMLKELSSKKEDMDRTFSNFKPKVTKDQLLDALSLLEEISARVSKIYEFDNDELRRVTHSIIKRENTEQILIKRLNEIDIDIQNASVDKHIKKGKKFVSDSEYRPILIKPPGCDRVCPFEDFYEEVLGIKREGEISVRDSERDSLERERVTIEEAMAIYGNINAIRMTLEANRILIDKLPFDYLDYYKLVERIQNSVRIYDESEITKYISLVEKYNEYTKIGDRISSLQNELSTLRHSEETLKFITESYVKKKSQVENLDSRIESTLKELNELKNRSEELNKMAKSMEKALKRSKHMESMKNELERIEAESNKLRDRIDKGQEYEARMREYDKLHYSQRLSNESLRNEINIMQRQLHEYMNLKEEEEELNEKYNDLTIIREALSSNKGIPLIYMNMYMMQTISQINSLLDIVYDGNLRIVRFDIDGSNFKIPYIKNGVEVSDVSQCSQGEETFISLALSFAFISMSIDKYNILLLDELDGPLDANRRNHFLEIIEEQLAEINATQIHIISHNKAFDDYPVNVVQTSPGLIDNYNNKTIIFGE